ncbi:MAG TPA: hypothetical protein VKU80_15450, partial [Planctomycetota bacterium]|nr:hypothetical protein [Planctomycetota bacterium]
SFLSAANVLLTVTMLGAGAASPAPLGVLPDPALTPGATDPAVTQETLATTICVPGYTARVRNVSQAEKRQVLAAYRAKHPDWPACLPGACEYDHMLSLEAGGSNEPSNIWPEPYEIPGAPGQGARDKDKVENAMHRLICSGRISLKEAQARLVKDWRTAVPQ